MIEVIWQTKPVRSGRWRRRTVRASWGQHGRFQALIDLSNSREKLLRESFHQTLSASPYSGGDFEAAAALPNLRSQRALERAGFVATGEALVDAPARAGALPARKFALVRSTPRFGALPAQAGLSSCCAGR